MPKAYSHGSYVFVLVNVKNGVHYYRISHCGIIVAYEHPFNSISEMDNYSAE